MRNAGFNGFLRDGIANGGFEIAQFGGLRLAKLPGDSWFASTEFATEREERPSEDFADMAMLFSLELLKPVEETRDSRQRRIWSRKVFFISRLRDRFPKMFQRGDRDRALGIEEIVQTSLPDAGAGANLIYGDRVIALLPKKLAGGIQEALSCVTGASHKSAWFRWSLSFAAVKLRVMVGPACLMRAVRL